MLTLLDNNLLIVTKGVQIMSNYDPNYYQAPCEFTIPIKLNVPIEIEPKVLMKAPQAVKQKVPVHLEPDLYITPELQAEAPVCVTKNGHDKQQYQAN